MRSLIFAFLLLPSVAMAADGDACAAHGYETMRNATACVLVCHEAGGFPYACNGGTGYLPPDGYRGGAVHVEIADGADYCEVEVSAGSSSAAPHVLDVLRCDGHRRLVIPAGEHLAGRLYLTVEGGWVDVLAHWELGED